MSSASSADNSGAVESQMMMADSGSIEEVAVIGNTDITTTESENNFINTVVVLVFPLTHTFLDFCSFSSLTKTFLNRPNVILAWLSLSHLIQVINFNVAFSKNCLTALTVC